ncbi:MAG: hypothetical protein GY768_04820 [Planctomycetaceae bacterium]|nr:hypothetical protein [Planctomycetaceae bacterium]
MIKQCQNPSEQISRAAPRQDFHKPFRGWSTWILLGSVLIASQLGCSSYHLAKRTLHCELNEYPQVTDGKISCRKYRGWAKQEWQRIRMESGETFSNDYASGFLQGFVDQVYAGGKPIAPPIPPRKYWRVGYRNADGRRAVEEWYHGFEHGAQIAHESGYRAQAVVPSSIAPGSGEGLRLREGYDNEPVLVPEDILNPVPNPDAAPDDPDEADPVFEELQTPNESLEQADASDSQQIDAPRPVSSVLPVSFETAAPAQLEAPWGESPPIPPWQASWQDSDSQPVTNTDRSTSQQGEFDPFQGSVITGPELTGPKTSSLTAETDADQQTRTADSKSDTPFVGSVLELNSPQNGKPTPPKRSSGFSETNKPDAVETNRPATAEPENSSSENSDADQDGWQSKTEPTPWQSRDKKDEQQGS